MATMLLNSRRAVEMSVFVARAFIQIRGTLSAHRELAALTMPASTMMRPGHVPVSAGHVARGGARLPAEPAARRERDKICLLPVSFAE